MKLADVTQTAAKVHIRMSMATAGELARTVPIGYRRHLIEAALKLIVAAIKESSDPTVLTDILNGHYELKRRTDEPPGTTD